MLYLLLCTHYCYLFIYKFEYIISKINLSYLFFHLWPMLELIHFLYIWNNWYDQILMVHQLRKDILCNILHVKGM